MNFINSAIIFIIKYGTQIICRIDAPDLDKVPPKGPLILYTNHTGQIEVPILFAHLQPRKLIGWAKAEAWDGKFIGWLFDQWGAIPLKRGEADTAALKGALQALKNEAIFGLAPEGTRNRTGILKRGLPGVVMLAMHSGAPLLPVAHWGGEDFLSNIKNLKRTDFHIRVGEPIKIIVERSRVTAEMRQQIVDEMMYRVAELLPEQYRGEYTNRPAEGYQYTQKY